MEAQRLRVPLPMLRVLAGRVLGVHRARPRRGVGVFRGTTAHMGRMGSSRSLCSARVSGDRNPKAWSPRDGLEGLWYVPSAEVSRSSAQRRRPYLAPEPGHRAGAREAGAAEPQQGGPSPPPAPPSLGCVSGCLARRPGRGGAVDAGGRAGPERGGAQRGQQRIEGLAGSPALCGARRRRARGLERAGGEARRWPEELGAAPRAPLLHGAAWTARAAPRRVPQGTQPAGDGGPLPGLRDHPGLHQPPSAAASQGEGRAGAQTLSRDFVARLPPLRARRWEGGSVSRSPCGRLAAHFPH